MTLKSPQDADQLCLPAIHTTWPMVRVYVCVLCCILIHCQIWVFGVSYTRDGSCVTRQLAEYNGLDVSQRPALKEMCLRVLLLLKQTLDAINNAKSYEGKLRIPQLTKDAKHATSASPTSGSTPGGALSCEERR